MIVEIQLSEGWRIVDAVDEDHCVSAFKVEVEDRSVGLLSCRIVVGESKVVPFFEGAVDHDGDIACILIGFVKVSDE